MNFKSGFYLDSCREWSRNKLERIFIADCKKPKMSLEPTHRLEISTQVRREADASRELS